MTLRRATVTAVLLGLVAALVVTVVPLHESENASPGTASPPETAGARPLAGDLAPTRSAAAAIDAHPAVRYEVRLLDLEERPLLGGRVSVVRMPGPGSPDHPERTGFTVAASPDGRGLVPAEEAPDAQHWVLGEAPGCVAAVRPLERSGPTVLHLAPGASVVGYVVERATRRPVAGARVTYEREEWPPFQRPSAVTDGAGWFRLEGILAGVREACTVAPPGAVASEHRVHPEGPGETSVVFEVDLSRELRGFVLHALDRSPVPGVTVRVTQDGGALVTTAGDDGGFQARVAAGRAVSVEASMDGLAGSRLVLEQDEVPEGPLTLLVLPECVLQGTVRDAGGSPLAGIPVLLYLDERFLRPEVQAAAVPFSMPEGLLLGTLGLRSVRTDSGGRYRHAGLSPFTPCTRLTAVQGRSRLSRDEIRLGEPGVHTVDFQFPDPSTRLSGRVTLDGEPADGVVQWFAPPWSGSAELREGSYEFAGLPAGAVDVEVRTWDPLLRRRASLSLTPGTATRHDLALNYDPDRILGRVVTADGSGISGVPVKAVRQPIQSESQTLTTVTGAGGHFAFDLPDPAAGEWWVEVQERGCSVTAGSEDVVFTRPDGDGG